MDTINDDCLLEIISYLSLGDLYNLGRINRRLNALVAQVYNRYDRLDANELTITCDKLKTVGRMRSIIKEVAQYVTSFKICRKIYSRNGLLKCRRLIILVILYCNNLIELKIEFYIHDDRTLRELWALPNFRKLATIDIRGDIKLQHFTQLKSLTLKVDKEEFNVVKLLSLKNLQCLCLDIPMQVSANLLLQLCDNNPGIKQMKLNILTDRLIRIIVFKLVHLEEFTLPPKTNKIRYTVTGIQRISQIKLLKRFTASDSIPGLLTELAHLDQLEALTFTGISSCDMYKIKYFSKLKYLKTTNLNGAQLNALRSLRILEHLDISDSNFLIETDDVVRFVMGAVKLKYLALCNCNGVDRTILKKLSKLFQLGWCCQKLTIVYDSVPKHDTKDYPCLDLRIQKSVRFS